LDEYKRIATRLLADLVPFGVDKANSNCSRLSRLPGANRLHGAIGDGLQRLLFLNPSVPPLQETDLKAFEDSLSLPAIDDKPLRKLVAEALPRYQSMRANAGRLGVPYGIPQLDHLSGGMKPGQTIAVSGKTGGCKSTYAMHVITTALDNHYGVSLFSLEMDREEVFDLMVSKRLRINRNKFNHGRFTDYDFHDIEERIGEMEDLPLYINDSSLTSADQIRLEVMQLKSAGKIHLVVVDYIQFVNPEWSKDNREQQVAQISHKLRSLAREAKIPFVVLSQLNDEGKLRESRVIAHNANVVLSVEVEKSDKPNLDDTVRVSVTKGRSLPLADYNMKFDRSYATLIGDPHEQPGASHLTSCPPDTEPQHNNQ
jgi:replicative DNA helicase